MEKPKGDIYEECGFVTQMVMLDPTLSIEAKAIYAYIAALAGEACEVTVTVEDMAYHLMIGRNRLLKHKRELLESSYIEVEKSSVGGKFNVNKYILVTQSDH